ncbi:MAG: glycine--tRNA ligase [Phycisphaera sp.]|nr:MAG: glycine--tRNA ligase [Phycisphaera sp.]
MSDATDQQPQTKSMDDIMSLCKRRGFIYQASEIYGGVNGFWDYGPLGAQLKKNLRDAWWQDIVMNPCQGKLGPKGGPVSIVPVDTCIIQNPKVWEASGHVGGFNDPMVDDKETKQRFRADHLFGLYVIDGSEFTVGGAVPDSVEWNQLALENPAYAGKIISTVIAGSVAEAIGHITQDPKQVVLDCELNLRVKKATLWSGPNTDYPETSALLFSLSNNQQQAVLVLPIKIGQVAIDDFYPPDEVPSPFSGRRNTLTLPRDFNLMFKTYLGATATEDDIAYLRPETAQGIFINFKNVVDTTRVSVPFGIAQTGKAFRNEVTPRNFTFRSREFEQMEIEFFCHPEEANDWYAFWRDWRMQWWQEIGLAGENLILREHDKDELAHYAKEGAGTSDIEYRFPFTAPGFGELEGIAHRSNYDLSAHQNHPESNTKLEYLDTTRGELAKNGQPKGERYLPDVIEPSAGLDRGVLAILCEAYTPDPERPSKVYMKFHPRVAPIKAAVFPLVNKDGMPEKAAELHRLLVKRFGHLGKIETDPKQSIGKRYARMDEAGCPFCFTIDGDTLTDGTVTVRDRDTAEQKRIPFDDVVEFVATGLGLG